jgi:hypothetical protein
MTLPSEMPLCGPKLSLCGVVLSIWGIIQLSIMGVFFYINSVALIEDINLEESYTRSGELDWSTARAMCDPVPHQHERTEERYGQGLHTERHELLDRR